MHQWLRPTHQLRSFWQRPVPMRLRLRRCATAGGNASGRTTRSHPSGDPYTSACPNFAGPSGAQHRVKQTAHHAKCLLQVLISVLELLEIMCMSRKSLLFQLRHWLLNSYYTLLSESDPSS